MRNKGIYYDSFLKSLPRVGLATSTGNSANPLEFYGRMVTSLFSKNRQTKSHDKFSRQITAKAISIDGAINSSIASYSKTGIARQSWLLLALPWSPAQHY
jgi:hypothetical protein